MDLSLVVLASRMHVVLDKFGSFLGKKENRFQILVKGELQKELSADNVRQFIIADGCSLSSGAINLAAENNIDIVFLGKFGQPKSRIYPCTLGGTTLTRKRQLEAYFSNVGLELSKSFVSAKVANQLSLLKSMAKTRKNKDMEKSASKLEEFSKRIEKISGKTIDEAREELLGIEGYVASEYFAALSSILPFKKREHDAKDPFNAMLNYGYGILYSEVERACILAGLDPYLGFLHTDRYGKPSMVLDLIEEFRTPIVDRAIINLFVRKQVEDSDFESNGETFLLSKAGKKMVIEAVLAKLYGKDEVDYKERLLCNIIVEQVRKVARFVLGEADSYKSYTV